ncbi:MAG TPA: hypothetical protein PLO61_10890 [Fimbriimonadaceae bacterium]|nr:hypothetical protein [Fimbriimonadaceae bacterium]HRJ34145.1 hypothetical protein [Fimbriimonadaceae bacterium]
MIFIAHEHLGGKSILNVQWARRGIGVVAGLLVLANLQAAIMDTVTFTGVEPAVTGAFTSGTLRQRTSPASYTLGRIDYSGNTVEINGTTGDWVNDNQFRTIFPGGAPSFDRLLGSQQSYSGTVTYAGSFFLNSGATVPVSGVYDFLFINTVDDSPAGQRDNSMTITFNFTDEVPAAPPSTPVSVTPGVNALTTAALNVSAGGIVWYKVTVLAATDTSKYLDIHTNGSGVDLDFGWFNSSGNNLLYRDGQASSWEPWLSFGAGGETRPPVGNIVLEGQDGNLVAGTYYLAVGFYPMSIGSNWSATTSSANTYVGVTAFQSGVIAPPVPPPTPIYEQLKHTAGAPGGDALSVLSGSLDGGVTTFDRQFADDVVVPNPGWNITGVSGTFLDGGGLTPSSVEVTFYQRLGGGQPGAVLGSFVRPWSAVTLFNEGIYFGSTALRMLVDLGGTQALAPGSYMVAVRPVAATGNNYFWLTSSPTNPIVGNAAFYRRGPAAVGQDASWPSAWTVTGSGGVFPTAQDLAYALYGSVAAPSNVVSGTVDFGQLTAAYNSGANLPSSIPVSFRDGSNTEIATGSATYNPVTGAFSAAVPGAVTVPYRVSFKLGFWLRKTMPNPSGAATPLGNYAFGTVTPLVGDSDDDNEVTNFDYSLWAAANGNSVTANTDNDFDGDGEITNFDYSLWAANNGALGDN